MAPFDLNERDTQSFPVPEHTEALSSIRLSDIISALSYALDLTEGQPMGHSVRACMIGMRLAQQIGMSVDDQADLYYALLLKDAGCSSNASRLFHILTRTNSSQRRRQNKGLDACGLGKPALCPDSCRHRHAFPGAHAEAFPGCRRPSSRIPALWSRFAANAAPTSPKQLGFSESVAAGIYSLDEHWNGRGYPDGLRKDEIPMFSRIANLSQTLDVFYTAHGPEAAIEAAQKRSGRWFDPDLVKAAVSLASSGALWRWAGRRKSDRQGGRTRARTPPRARQTKTRSTISAPAFAEVIDAKSPFTYRHSSGVADAAVEIGRWSWHEPPRA